MESRRHRSKWLAVPVLLGVLLAPSPPVEAGESPEGGIESAIRVVREGMKSLSLSERAILPKHDFIPSDGFRIGLIDEYLSEPLGVPLDAHRRFSPWIFGKETLADSLRRALGDLGFAEIQPSSVETRKDLAEALIALHGAASTSGGGDAPNRKELDKKLRSIPRPLRLHLAGLVSAVETAVRERQTAFSKLGEDEWVRLRRFGSQFNTGADRKTQMAFLKGSHARIDLPRIYSAALALAKALDGLKALGEASARERKKPSFHLVFDTPAGRVEFGGWGEDSYEDEALLIVDFGGRDHYSNSAGGTLYTPAKVSVVVDLAGDDRYENPKGLAQGSGMYGIGILVDCGGADKYKANKASQGSGHAGVGILWDISGNDRYEAWRWSQGAGFQGVGLLRDDEGMDDYNVGISGQGCGGTQGFGILQDLAGDDTYRAGGLDRDRGRDEGHYLSMAQGFASGNRSGELSLCSSGGIGLLADAKGADTYIADVFAQGCAYWYAIGALLDGEGDDLYVVYNYGAGGGFHMAVGIQMDFEGNDRYEGGYHALGHSLDRSVGWFIDFSGNDIYRVMSGSEAPGAAVKPLSVAFFADLEGDDAYRNGMPGYVRVPAEDYKGLWPKAFFLDLGGKDRYSPEQGDAKDGGTWKNNRYGWGTDR